MTKEIKEELIEILKRYSCWTLKDNYGCIPKLANEILALLGKTRLQTIRELDKKHNALCEKKLKEQRKQLEERISSEQIRRDDMLSKQEAEFEKKLREQREGIKKMIEKKLDIKLKKAKLELKGRN